MIFKHKLLTDSAVMKEFEKIAISKGMAKAEVLSKMASDESVNLIPSKDLIIDMLNLAEGLRSKGFEKDAESLESKVLAYKKAETHLYRAIDEDADDMLEFAHPKKNRVKFDAKDGHGEFEDTRTQHDKMVAIVNKKVANEYNVVLEKTAEILGLKKKADLDEVGKKLELIKYYKSQLIKFSKEKNAYYSAHYQNSAFVRDGDSNELSIGTTDSGYSLIEGYSKTWDFPDKKEHVYESKFLDYFCNSNNIVIEKLNDLRNGDVSFAELISNDDVDHANQNLNSVYKTFFDKIDSIPALSATSSNSEINSLIDIVKSLFDENSWFIIKGLTNNDGLVENQIRNAANSLLKITAELIKLSGQSTSSTTPGMDEIFHADFANVVADRFEKAALVTNDKESDPNYFNNAAKIIKANIDKPYSFVYDALKTFDPDLGKLTDKNKLDLWIQAWQKHFKIASTDNLITKKAKGDAPESSSSTIPASTKIPYSDIRSRTSPPAQFKSNFEQTYPEEYTAVSNMQDAVHKLADSLPVLLKGTDPNLIDNIIGILKGTGYGEKGSRGVSTDGEWGPATQKALEAAQVILTKLNQNVKLTTEAQRNQGKANIDTKDIAKLANENTNTIYGALNTLGVDVKDKIKTTDDNSPYVDSLPANVNILGEVVATEDSTSGIDLAKNNLSSFNNLFNFLRIHGLTEADGFNVKDWDKIIRWFYNRASQQLIQTKKKSKAEYKILLEKLFTTLQDYVSTNPNNNQVVSSKNIDGAATSPASMQKSNGPTQNASSNSQAEGGDVENMQNVNKVVNAPFGYNFVPADLHRSQLGNAMIAYSTYEHFANTEIQFNVNDFEYDPLQIISKYVGGENGSGLTLAQMLLLNGITAPTPQIIQIMQTDNMKKRSYLLALRIMCKGLLGDLYGVFKAWKTQNPQRPGQSDKNANIAWDKWSNSLGNMISRIDSDLQQNGAPPALGMR